MPRPTNDDDDEPVRPRRKKPVVDDDDEPVERPRRKKAKKPVKTNRNLWIFAGVGGGILAIILIVVLVVVLIPKLGPTKATTPTEFFPRDSTADVFHISTPGGWKTESGGLKNYTWLTSEKGSASVKVNESLAGSLMGDIAEAGRRDMNGGDEFLPVSRVHEFKKAAVAEEIPGYQEQPATTVTTGFGKGRRSAFAARGVRGYRATVLGTMTQLTVLCTCAPGDWDTLEPAFTRVIESIGPGKSP